MSKQIEDGKDGWMDKWMDKLVNWWVGGWIEERMCWLTLIFNVKRFRITENTNFLLVYENVSREV